MKNSKQDLFTPFYVSVLTLMCILGCSGDPEPRLEIEVVSGPNQVVSQLSVVPVVIRVTDGNEKPKPDLEIIAVASDEGRTELQNSKTDHNGELTINWNLSESYTQILTIDLANGKAPSQEISVTTSYAYQIPEKINDQWEVGDLKINASNPTLLLKGIDRIRAGFYDTFHSVLVVNNKELVLEEYFPGRSVNGTLINYDKNTIHVLESASKSVRSAFIGIAIDKGIISGVDEKLFSFFPEFGSLVEKEPLKDEITLEDILTMSSGLEWNENLVPFGENNTLSIMYSKPQTGWVSYLLNQPMEFNPGAVWNYNTGASLMLRNIIERALNTDIDNFLKTHYWGPIGSPVRVASGYRQTPREMAKLGYIYLYDGFWQDKEILSKEWIDKSTRPHFHNISGNADYGYQWWLREFNSGGKLYSSFHASGNGGQYIVVIKELDISVVITGGNFGSSSIPLMTEFISSHVIPAFANN